MNPSYVVGIHCMRQEISPADLSQVIPSLFLASVERTEGVHESET